MESPPGGQSRGAPPPSSPEQGVWGDIDDWHETLELIARKWGGGPHAAPSRLPSKRATEAHALPNQQPSPAASKTHEGGARTREKEGEGEEKNVAAAATAAGAQLKPQQQPSSAPPALLAPPPGDKSRNRRSSIEPLAPSLASPAVDSPRNGGSARSPHSPSRKQRHTASLPRPSDVEALLRKETQRRRPSSPAPQAVFISSTATHADDASLAADVNGATATSNGESDGGEPNGAPNLDAKRGSSAYSAPTDLRDAFVSINHAAGAPNNEGLVLSLMELQKRPVPSTLNKATLEVYLSDDEFSSALGMPRDQFYSLRAWKQTQVKKKAGLL